MRKAVLLVVMALAYSAEAGAAKFSVDKTSDGRALSLASACTAAADDCTLRDAVRKANQNPDADVIFIPSGLYRLTLIGDDDTAFNGDLDVTEEVTIDGAGADPDCGSGSTCIDASAISDAVFAFLDNTKVTLRDVTVRGGETGVYIENLSNVDATQTIDDCAIVGNSLEGIYVGSNGDGEVVIRNSKISGNTGLNGISNYNGKITIENSLISDNDNVADGAVENDGNLANMVIKNSTVSGNSSNGNSGGGIRHKDGSMQLQHVTVTGNHSVATIGGLFSDSVLVLENSIIAGNTAASGSQDCGGSSLSSKKYNLIGTVTGCGIVAATGDLFGSDATPVDPKLGSLENNGGRWESHLLLAGSPAIDAGNPVTLRDADQRGAASPFDGDGNGSVVADIGAVEIGCGNSFIESGEACDDGNAANGDGCSSACANEVAPACGDGILQAGEGCDDGNTDDDDACKNDCTVPAGGGTTGGDTGGDTGGTGATAGGGTSGDSGGGCSLVR